MDLQIPGSVLNTNSGTFSWSKAKKIADSSPMRGLGASFRLVLPSDLQHQEAADGRESYAIFWLLKKGWNPGKGPAGSGVYFYLDLVTDAKPWRLRLRTNVHHKESKLKGFELKVTDTLLGVPLDCNVYHSEKGLGLSIWSDGELIYSHRIDSPGADGLPWGLPRNGKYEASSGADAGDRDLLSETFPAGVVLENVEVSFRLSDGEAPPSSPDGEVSPSPTDAVFLRDRAAALRDNAEKHLDLAAKLTLRAARLEGIALRLE